MSDVKKRIASRMSIPTLPQVVARIASLADDPEAGSEEIGAAVAEDAPITAKVLKIANSAFYGQNEAVLSTRQAATVLGTRVLKNIATQAAVIEHFDSLRAMAGFDLDGLWRHSIATGQVCALLARRSRRQLGLEPEEFNVVGLLHDVGKLVLLEALGTEYLDTLRTSELGGEPLSLCEQRALGFNHCEIGAMLATRWNLPLPVKQAIQYHHGPREALQRHPVVCLVANVNLLVHRIHAGEEEGALSVIDEPSRGILRLSLADVGETIAEAVDMLPQIVV